MGKKVSAEIAFLLVVVPLSMYTCFLLLGIRFGRLLEREADNNGGGGGGLEIIMGGGGGLHALQPWGVTSMGPWGGSGGQPFYMRGASPPCLRRIVLYHSGAIHSLACDYTLAGGDVPRLAGPWGLPHSYGSVGVRTEIELSSGEHITAVEGTTGHFGNVVGVVITSLTFRTSSGRTYGPYGSMPTGSHYFSVPVANGACIAGFWGRSGWLLDAIGVYVKPSCSPSSSGMAAYNKYASILPSSSGMAAYNKEYASRLQSSSGMAAYNKYASQSSSGMAANNKYASRLPSSSGTAAYNKYASRRQEPN